MTVIELSSLTSEGDMTYQDAHDYYYNQGGFAAMDAFDRLSWLVSEGHITTKQHDEITAAFVKDWSVTVLEESIEGYRYYGGSASVKGHWLSKYYYSTAEEVYEKLALPPSNTVEKVARIKIPAGTVVIEGTVAKQPNWGRMGGGYQYYAYDTNCLEIVYTDIWTRTK